MMTRAVRCYNTVDSNVLFKGLVVYATFISPATPLVFRKVILCGGCVPVAPLKNNNEDLQNAKRHMGVSLIAAVSYQSLKQIAYQLHSYVLDMSTMLCRGDLSKIMHIKDDGTRLIHFKVN